MSQLLPWSVLVEYCCNWFIRFCKSFYNSSSYILKLAKDLSWLFLISFSYNNYCTFFSKLSSVYTVLPDSYKLFLLHTYIGSIGWELEINTFYLDVGSFSQIDDSLSAFFSCSSVLDFKFLCFNLNSESARSWSSRLFWSWASHASVLVTFFLMFVPDWFMMEWSIRDLRNVWNPMQFLALWGYLSLGLEVVFRPEFKLLLIWNNLLI